MNADPFRTLEPPPGGLQKLRQARQEDGKKTIKRQRQAYALAMAIALLVAIFLWPQENERPEAWTSLHPALSLLGEVEEPVRIRERTRHTTALRKVETHRDDVVMYDVITIRSEVVGE